MNILVTGSNGQLGSEIRALSNRSLLNSFFFTDINELDITQKNGIEIFVKENKIDIVINCAAYTQVDKAEDDRDSAFLVNATAPRNIAELCFTYQIPLIHISTDYVFDGCSTIPYKESDTTSPLGVYGESKLEGETFIKRSGCNNIVIRTSWLYSIYGENFVKKIGKLVQEKKELKVVFDQVGTPTYARDLAKVILTIIEKNKTNIKNQIYHFSNEGVCSWYDFAISINRMLGSHCRIAPCLSDEFPSIVKRPHYSVLDKTKIKSDFGIEIPYWEDSLKEYMDELK